MCVCVGGGGGGGNTESGQLFKYRLSHCKYDEVTRIVCFLLLFFLFFNNERDRQKERQNRCQVYV